MDYEEDSNIFAGFPAFDEEDSGGEDSPEEPSSAVKFLSRPELEALSRDGLFDYVAELQRKCSTMESENNFLSWEFRDYQQTLTNFSRAAKLAHELNAADMDDIAWLSTEDVRIYFDCRYAALFLYNLEETRFEMHRSTSPELDERLSIGRDTFLARFFANYRHPFLIEFTADAQAVTLDNGEVAELSISPEWKQVLGEKALVFPLRIEQGEGMDPLTLGGLIMGDARRGLEARDADVAVFFADLLASGLYNAQLLKKLNDLTIIDPLTQIYNRRHLINQLTSAMVQAKRNGHPLSVAMLDIDFFKQFNDKYGHICGDEVLRSVAGTIKGGIRTGVDVPARYGGEEFVIVMPFTDLEAGYGVAERIRVGIGGGRVRYEGWELAVTASCGVAGYREGETLEHFLDRADAALYEAKHSGRDRVCVAE